MKYSMTKKYVATIQTHYFCSFSWSCSCWDAFAAEFWVNAVVALLVVEAVKGGGGGGLKIDLGIE